MKTAIYAIACLLLSIASQKGCGEKPSTTPSTTPGQWVPLFNGKNLDGWDVKIAGFDLNDNYQNTFRVEDGMIKVDYSGYKSFDQRYGHLFYKKPFSHYRLRVEYRFVGEQAPNGEGWALRNSGVMLHGQSAASMMKGQDFPISIEAQFLGGNGKDERHTSNLCTPGTHVTMNGKLEESHCIDSRSKTYHGDQWVTAEFLVLGDSLIQHILEGEVVMEYTKPVIGGGVVNNFDPKVKKDGQPLRSGTISLQSESHPIHFRKVEVMELVGK
ncbi:MAG: DUF1080 domain-containing protein [Saprospiraceae bacterium]|nr:DUF1080 domain-containing protein [Saprospiraceae bacterium]